VRPNYPLARPLLRGSFGGGSRPGVVLVALGTAILLAPSLIHAAPSPDSVNLSAACINGIQVDVNGSAAPATSVTSISWSWGDSATTTGYFPQSHAYSSAGSYTVQATAYYTDGSSASSSQIVTVAPGVLSNCVALTIAAGVGGSVSYQASVGSATVPAGSSVTLQLDFADDLLVTANPGTGFSFSNWSGSGGVTLIGGAAVSTAVSPSIDIVIGSTASLTASFTAGS
jgi:PKD domain-containing protein/List-Bact-rpt repeat protein